MKFDTSTIDGFENMSDADKVTALLGVDLPDPVDTKNLVKKEDFDKVMSEASSYKKQLKEKMTAEETAAAEAKAAQEKLQNDYNALLKENTEAINAIKSDTADMLATFESWRGAMRVLEAIGRLARPVSYIVGLVASIAAFYTAVKSGVGTK